MTSSYNPPVELICEECGKHFKVPYWRTTDKKLHGTRALKYCSKECKYKAMRGYKRKRSTTDKIVNTKKLKGQLAVMVKGICKQCNKEFERPEYNAKKMSFCSRKCMAEYYSIHQRGFNHPLWKGGSSFGKYCYKFNTALKDKVSSRFNNECILCHTPKSENKMWNGKVVRLCIHHVYTEKMACCESKIEDMNNIRKRLPVSIARFDLPEFTEEEIRYIRMMVPLCKKCHGKMLTEEAFDIPYEQTFYRKFFTELILTKYDGLSYI